MLSLREESAQGPAAVGTPDGGDGAESASVAAALGKLEIGQVPGGGGEAGLRPGVIKPGGLVDQVWAFAVSGTTLA